MDIGELILTNPVSPPAQLESLSRTDKLSEERKKQVAKDFESVFINKLLETMRENIGQWGFEKDGASKQVQGIFNMYLAREIANKGGFGLWKDIYKSLQTLESKETEIASVDKKV